MTNHLVKLFIVFGPLQGSIKVIRKYANPGLVIDESLLSTLCLPRIETFDRPKEPRFLTFLITRENGQVLYGSGLIVYEPYGGRYANHCYSIITDTPFVHATRLLLHIIWEKRRDDLVIRCVMNIPLPTRRLCLRIVPPLLHSNSQDGPNAFGTRNIDDIYLYKGMTDLPLLDYPLRELFNCLNIDDFLLAFACILMELRTLIISEDNYKLMMVGEALTSLLLPLKWCNVYVPILPPVYGATYLDAPTSYIMGINTQVTELPDNLNHVQCKIFCDDSRVVCEANSLALPLFLNDIKQEIIKIREDFEANHPTNHPPSYLDDLKFNRAIRLLFIKTLRKNILSNYERYIVDVPESSSGIRQFDVVSYLSDKPEFMYSFLSKFLETQLFVSFIDDSAKRRQQSRLSILDMDADELSEHLTDRSLEVAFQSAHRVHLMDLRNEEPDIEVKTVPASPMKFRKRVPALSSITSRISSFASSRPSSNSSSVDHSEIKSGPIPTASPPIHRNSVAAINIRGHLSLDPSLHPSPNRTHNRLAQSTMNNTNNNNNTINPPSSLKSDVPMGQPLANGKIIELINEVRDLTKKILIERISTLDMTMESNGELRSQEHAKQCNNSTLIGALCDHIERVWAHGSFVSQPDNNSCPLWNHIVAFTRLKYLDMRPRRHQFADGSHLNVLSPSSRSETTELDKMVVKNHNIFSNPLNLFKINRFQQLAQPVRELINDLRTIQLLKDVKTDVGKARAFLRLSLERKRLSKHLRTLLGDQALLNSLYKPYAFLRCEEEREQFLTYLLTLNAVDLPCFTSTFVNVINTRQMKREVTCTDM